MDVAQKAVNFESMVQNGFNAYDEARVAKDKAKAASWLCNLYSNLEGISTDLGTWRQEWNELGGEELLDILATDPGLLEWSALDVIKRQLIKLLDLRKMGLNLIAADPVAAKRAALLARGPKTEIHSTETVATDHSTEPQFFAVYYEEPDE
ncbi:MAG: hypothetical protein ACPHK8_03835 [Thermoplasmatota archaeon]